MTGEVLTIALRVADGDLAERVVALLGAVAGIVLVPGEPTADLILSAGDPRKGLNADNLSGDMDIVEPIVPNASVMLTPREREVVALLAQGLSNKAIALRLGIAPDTAKFHVGRLIEKFDANGRTDAVAQAARLGIVQL